MMENYNFLFKYLDKENIQIDKSEFVFQISSHPNYPSVVSIVDTLDFFGIENALIKVDLFEIDILPQRFIVLLENENNETQLFFIEKKKGKLILYDENNKQKTVSRESIKHRWSSVVLLINKNNEKSTGTVKNKTAWLLPTILLSLFGAILLISDSTILVQLLFIFIFAGVLFSLATIKDLFDLPSNIFNKFCNLNETTSCSAIIDSKNWKFFNYINLSDLSIVFFVFQFFGFSYAIGSNRAESFIQIIFYLLLLASPMFLLSFYYQKFIVKKWCPICLAIIFISCSETIFIYFISSLNATITLQLVLEFGLIFTLILYSWSTIKKILQQKKELKEFQIKGLKFQRNYQLFRNSLLTGKKNDFPPSQIILGNTNATTIITLITNPFCGHCMNIHEIIDKILKSNGDEVKIQMLIKVDLENESSRRQKFYISLINYFVQKGEAEFKRALKEWFDHKDISKWMDKYSTHTNNEMMINSIYTNHNSWCIQNDYNYTPAIFINGYEYPNHFDREDLPYFIKEIIEDMRIDKQIWLTGTASA